MKIKPDDLVLEIGSGDKPYPRTDVLLDRLPEDSSEREAGRRLVIDRPMVIADGQALPFANKSFDYIIASHVLEHAENPAKFLSELSRVGKRGYIETPLPERERVFDWLFHRWYVYQNDKALVLVKKTKKSKKFFAGMSKDKRKNLYFLEGKKLKNLYFEWKGKIKCKIFPSEPAGFLENLDKELVKFQKIGSLDELRRKSTQDLKSKLLLIPGVAPASKWLKDNLFKIKFEVQRQLQARERKQVDLFSLIVCPACKSKLILKKGKFICSNCRRNFSLYQENVPVLLL